jgi:hypothetical protein
MHDRDDGHGAKLQPQIPVSAGTPMAVHILFVIALLIVFIQGAFVAFSSGFARVWPAANSVKIPL